MAAPEKHLMFLVMEILGRTVRRRPLLQTLLARARLTASLAPALVAALNAEGLQTVQPACDGDWWKTLPEGDYPWDAFNATLGALKDHSPTARTVTVVPTSTVSMQVLARAIDYARWAPMVPFDSPEATWHEWRSTRKDLFDTPVLTGGVP